MRPFRYEAAIDAPGAVLLGMESGARYLGGGTNLVDLMRERIETPDILVDVSSLDDEIRDIDGAGLVIGAGVKNTTVAADRRIREHYPLLAQAILAGASGQIRNMASVGGNIMQRTRCVYFFDDAARCNKREPGSGCDAIGGFNRNHAILGTSPACIATHPSDMCVALAALGATIKIEGPNGAREIPIVHFHLLPGETPHVETSLQPGELITGVILGANGVPLRSSYRKVRDRSSYAFALVSLAAGLELEEGIIKDVRLALGGVAHKPWRAHIAEAALRDGPPTKEVFRQAAEAELVSARGLRDNAFKIELSARLIADTLEKLTRAPGSAG